MTGMTMAKNTQIGTLMEGFKVVTFMPKKPAMEDRGMCIVVKFVNAL